MFGWFDTTATKLTTVIPINPTLYSKIKVEETFGSFQGKKDLHVSN